MTDTKKKIIFATGNQHKVEEVNQILTNTSFRVYSMHEIGITEDIPETGTTFEENAWIKANYIFQKGFSNCFAEDSGLVIDALNGEPGIYSSRYAGTGKAEDNIQKVLQSMKGETNRSGRFVSFIAMHFEGKQYHFEGKVEGEIAMEIQGHHGFGYDPIFIPNGYTYSFGQLPSQLKSFISHRAKATKKMIEFLQKNQ